ncbi:Phosphodiesterase [Meloidogyne graminicola]|uniref:Phosphodiesterase n=1 Tax=Meloidogyne graminicola TaxID=189291 RepID=A0A8S9ZE32_9BILA|nr:Phosphodiesterase [Meloidogyne graminicola]
MRWRCCASTNSVSSSSCSSSSTSSQEEEEDNLRQNSPNASPSNLIALKAVANGGKRHQHRKKKKKIKKRENNDGLENTKLRTLNEKHSSITINANKPINDSIIRRQPEGILKGTHQRTGRPPGRAVQYAEGTNAGIDTSEGQPMLSKDITDPSSPSCSSPSPPTSFSSNGDHSSSYIIKHLISSQMEQYGPMLVKNCKKALFVINYLIGNNGNLLFNKSFNNDCQLFNYLKKSGWEIEICTSQQSLLNEIRNQRPVIIFLDGISNCSSKCREHFVNELLRILKDEFIKQSKQLINDFEDILFIWLFDKLPNERRLRHMTKQTVQQYLLRTSTDISLCEQFSHLSSRLRAVPALFTVIEESQQPIKICDENNIVQYVNKAFEMLTGRNRTILLGSDGSSNDFSGGAFNNNTNNIINNHIATATISASSTAAVAPTSIAWTIPPPPPPPVMMITGIPPIAKAESICEETDKQTNNNNSPTFPLNNSRRRSSDWQCIAVPTSSKSQHQYVYVKRGSADAAFFRSEKGGRSSNAALVDAPITEALNALASIFHRCDEETQIQLREAMRILSSSELYTPTITRFRENDRIASGYYDGLIRLHHPTRQRKRSVVDAYRDHQQRRASSGSCISGLTTSSTLGIQQQQNLKRQHFNDEKEQEEEEENNLIISNNENINIFKQKGRRVSAEINKVLEKEHCWDFDVIELERVTDSHPLANLGFKIFERWSVSEALHCSSDVLHKWLTVIEANYQSGNAYHNATHAADVLQATSYFLSSDPVGQLIQDNHALAALIAATVHDLDHPGRGNAFLMNTRQRLAILYNDHSILENHHVALAFQLTLSQPGVNIFAQMPREDFVQLRQAVIDMVLATDMSRHFEHLAKFQQLMAILPGNDEEENEQEEEEEDRDTNSMIICRMMVKCADIANPTREWRLCHEWALRIVQEYFDQTAEEIEKKLPVTMKGFDRETCNVPLTQCTFVDMFARETFTGWCEFAALSPLLTRLEENYERWKAQASDWEPQRNDNANLLALREKQWRRKSST